ncbi:Late embryogenesis abundant protein [Microbulbifer aggregans]|uniref:Late embryogenesis abundant protein n=1 Tax=Microbulbifer aggregans TaxID=1769779 RepID=A0A1C9WAK9_9GAMM|nr:LEA type 2 family protein [Microbulbifer aggregans]AOS98184.1 Late embryogenesis abundant protein [Microbulbifer aggregans]
MRRSIPLLLALGLLLGLAGCAVLSPSFQEPEVEIVALQPLPSSGNELRFRIQLRVFNPNSSELALSGLYYTLKLAGHKVVTGTASDLKPVAPYGQEDITVDATASLVGSLMAAADLLGRPRDSVPYELEAKLGLRRSILPALRVTKRGEISLNQYGAR